MKNISNIKQRKSFLVFLFLFFTSIYMLNAQSVGITDDGSAPDGSAMLQIQSYNSPYKGFLMPRLTLAQKTSIASPATGLLLYQTDGANGFWYYEGGWKQLGRSGWELTGNAGTVAGTNFLGTTDAIDFVIKTNSAERIRVTSAGLVGIGTAAPTQKLTINGNSLTIGTHYLNNTNTALSQGNGNALRVTTNSGYTEIGPQNTGWSHFYTDRSRYYFNAGITVDEGFIGSYDENLSLQTSGTTRITALTSNGYVGINNTNPGYLFTVTGGGIGGNYALLPNYAGWASYGTGDGQAAIYNDNGSYQCLMLVGNSSAGGVRKVGLWDYLTINGKIKINDGTQGAGKILTSDASGEGTWTNPQSILVYGNNAQNIKLSSIQATTSGSWVDIPGMSITMTTLHNTIYVFSSLGARLARPSDHMAQLGQAVVAVQILVDGTSYAQAAGVITDSDMWYYGVVTSGTVAFAGIPITVTPGSHTIKLQWMVVVPWASGAWQVEINPTLGSVGDHCILTVFD
jgi:hypothetical protein